VATYKVLQDIEAEDHILGPFTLRQFIFGMIAAFMLYICFIVVIKHVIFLLVLFLPPAVFFGFFALPFGRDQPTEIWFLAKLRFWFKPRRRVWNQSGVKELVTITVPKKVERVLTNGLSQNEVKSRLSVLAQTLDSRGWALKHAANAGAAYAPPPMAIVGGSDDRLLGLDSLPQEVPTIDAVPAEDMLDETTSPLARQFDTMINQSSQAHRQRLMTQLNGIQAGQGVAPAAPMPQIAGSPGNWFMGHTATDAPAMEPTVSGGVTSADDDEALGARLAAQSHSKQVSFGNLRTMRPLSASPPPAPAPTPSATPMPVMPDPAILSLASSNDLNVATLARQAKRNKGGDGSPDEVVISLH
jgi:PrgI family protein